jgi:hypothetical protein
VFSSDLINNFSYIADQTVRIEDKRLIEYFNFPISDCDILFTLTYSNNTYKENVHNLIRKMVFIKEKRFINLDTLSKIFAIMGINELYIFSIDEELKESKIIIRNNGCIIRYIEILPDDQF